MSFRNLQHLLETVAAREGSGNVISYPLGSLHEPRVLSYNQLFMLALKASQVLRSREDFQRGRVVLLHFNAHLDIIIWFWAVLFVGCLPALSIPFSNHPSHRTAHLEHLSKMLSSPICLTRASLLPEFGGQEAIDPIAVESFDVENASPMESSDICRDSSSDDNAILMLTSGSTGYSKAVCLSHGQILAAITGKYWVIELPEMTSFMNWVGLDHVAAMIEIHLQAMYGCKDQIHVQAPDVLSNPMAFIDLIHKHRVSRTFAPNFFLGKIRATVKSQGEFVQREWDLSCLRYIASGGEAVVTRTCEEVSKLLEQYGAPPNAIVPGFGMTETCAGAIFNTNFPCYDVRRSAEFASVGSCMPGISMRISDGENKPLPAGEIGSLEVSGPVVFQEYFNNPSATAEAFTPDNWFRTGDRGVIDEAGNLTLVGRAKETMIVNGVNYYPHAIESALDEANIPGLTRSFNCCFSSFPPGGDTEEIVVVYLPDYAPEDMIARVQTTDAMSKVVMMSTGCRPKLLPLDRSMLQKSAIGKLSRAKIKTAYEKGDYQNYLEINEEMVKLYRRVTRKDPKDALEQQLLSIFTNSLDLPAGEFDVQTPIFDMGITSIELIKLKKNIEEHLDLTQELPMITLMTNSTVRDLASALHDLQQKQQEYNPVVKLQGQGSKKPLWLVHPGVGEVLVFLNLAKFLVDRPVYALRARGFNDGETPFETIEEVVATYHAAIKREQPEGPYALAGYSYGSMLAFEVGKVLESHGDDVRFLGSFNLPPHIKARMRQLDWKECLLHLSYFLDLITEARSRELSQEFLMAEGGTTREEALARVMAEADQARLNELALSEAALVKWASLAFSLQSMAVDYDPSGSIAGMDVFYCIPLAVVASSKKQWREEQLSKWEDFTRSAPRFHDVGGAHYTMLSPEHVFGFQKTLRAALDARDTWIIFPVILAQTK
ncbi:non-ribosomal peptide synthetase [Aspergillus saccharolyticus JOP 1030-1]|uniref:Acetyl-CoA synthetase-like protein n=1 Tax=Aspergillus saccharolyticus JOP 1030-1 TaxID=1450539 RepID=A0A318Z108_9EURO|nr:acetyl-CoA synthetase-like protein [Aspergillus saccharolyticus JOP 1030-1]PYH40965.1 acetyl-CoA synthetase-like protein [Aspergillus saccharolyticus JOP 1030-1]